MDVSDLPDDAFVGINLHGVWDAIKSRYPKTLSRERWINELNGYYRAHADTLVAMPCALDTVATLAGAGIVQVAVSNSNRVVVDSNLKAGRLDAYMAFSLSLDDVPVGKPSPVPYQMAVVELGMAPRDVLAIEDSATGVVSAKAAGLFTVGIPQNNTWLPMADHVIHCLTELSNFIHSRNANSQKTGNSARKTVHID